MTRLSDTEIFDESEDSQDPQLTELVAYLDGELDENEAARLERQLAGDAPLRGYAETLDRTWRLLDSLGEATASGEFMQKTIGSLSTISSESLASSSRLSQLAVSFRRPAIRCLVWILVGFAGCSTGLLLSRTGQPNHESEDVQILRQLDLLQNVPTMYRVPDVEFLKQIMTLDPATAEVETTP